MNHGYGDDNLMVVWSNIKKCNITTSLMQQVVMYLMREKERERERERERESFKHDFIDSFHF